MFKKKFSLEEEKAKLRQVHALAGQGKSISQACKETGITTVSYYRWRRVHGEVHIDPERQLRGLERENTRLKKLVAELSLEAAILREVSKGRN